MAEQKIEPCPMPECGGECEMGQHLFSAGDDYVHHIICSDQEGCGYNAAFKPSEPEAIAAHNRVSRNSAAAGDLLAGCELLIAWGGEVRRQCGIIPWPCGIEDIHAAIAKAKGESNV